MRLWWPSSSATPRTRVNAGNFLCTSNTRLTHFVTGGNTDYARDANPHAGEGSFAAPRRRKFAGPNESHVVGEYLRMVEGQRLWRFVRHEKPGRFRIVARMRRPTPAPDVHDCHGMAARVAVRPRIDAQQRA